MSSLVRRAGTNHEAIPSVNGVPDLVTSPASGRIAAGQAAAARALVGRTMAEVEQDLILGTLDHCRGNRTRAAKILGISIRTLRNKLNEYTAAGVAVPEPGQPRPMGD
jgi:two-component system, response regulator FlrC